MVALKGPRAALLDTRIRQMFKYLFIFRAKIQVSAEHSRPERTCERQEAYFFFPLDDPD
jgi:hypothetical protein